MGRSFLLVGATNAGKTLFAVNFAAYLGARDLRLRRLALVPSREGAGGAGPGAGSGVEAVARVPFDTARRTLVSPEPYKTRDLAAIDLELSVGKGKQGFSVVDSAGLAEHIHGDADVRKGMAQTIGALLRADVVLHVIDAARVGEDGPALGLGRIDYEVARYARLRPQYLILANKMDLPEADRGLGVIREAFGRDRVMPVSALTMRGFREVRAGVRRLL